MMNIQELILAGEALSGFLFRDTNVKPACLTPPSTVYSTYIHTVEKVKPTCLIPSFTMVKINNTNSHENLFNEALTAEGMAAFNRLQEVWGDDEAYETLFRYH